jgi:hypothetical protein
MRYQKPRLNLSGVRFGRLIALKDVGSKRDSRLWECICDCGNKINASVRALKTGNTSSCGCLRKDTAVENSKSNIKHGLNGTGVYQSWNAMIRRCYYNTETSYPNYGGRGISVCGWLRDSPLNLDEVLGDRPPGLSLNRIDNDGHYSCGMCPECVANGWSRNIEWATRLEQNRNSRNCVYIRVRGYTKSASEWSEITGIPVGTILWRYKKGWTDDRLFSVGQCKI